MKKRILFSIICLLISILTFIYIFGKYIEKKTFDEPLFDNNAIVGTPTVSADLEYKELAAEGLYSISLCGSPSIEDNQLKLYLTSHVDNNVYLKARIFRNNKYVGESGIIKPGEYIESIDVKAIKSGDNILVKIMGYEMDNYYSAGTISVELNVR